MKNKLFFILLLCGLNAFSQVPDYKEKRLILYSDEEIESHKDGRFCSTSKIGNQNVITIGEKRKGVKQGEWLTFSESWENSYLKKVENYKNGKLHGYYFEIDLHNFSKEGYYKNGKMHGFGKLIISLFLLTRGTTKTIYEKVGGFLKIRILRLLIKTEIKKLHKRKFSEVM